jgi:hypothetical protein
VERAVPTATLGYACAGADRSAHNQSARLSMLVCGPRPGLWEAEVDRRQQTGPAKAQSKGEPQPLGLGPASARSTIDGYVGVCEQRAHERSFQFDADRPPALARRDK